MLKSIVLRVFPGKIAKTTTYFMIDQQTVLIEETIAQLLSGLDKTYVHFTDDEIWEDVHIGFEQRLTAVCEQDYHLNVSASKLISQYGHKWLEVENLGKYSYFPNILV